MQKIFYQKASSDWFFYYIILCIYGFFLNFASPFAINSSELVPWIGYDLSYFWNIFLGIVSFIVLPMEVRKRKLKIDEYHKSSMIMTIFGWIIVVGMFILNINSTLVLLLTTSS